MHGIIGSYYEDTTFDSKQLAELRMLMAPTCTSLTIIGTLSGTGHRISAGSGVSQFHNRIIYNGKQTER